MSSATPADDARERRRLDVLARRSCLRCTSALPKPSKVRIAASGTRISAIAAWPNSAGVIMRASAIADDELHAVGGDPRGGEPARAGDRRVASALRSCVVGSGLGGFAHASCARTSPLAGRPSSADERRAAGELAARAGPPPESRRRAGPLMGMSVALKLVPDARRDARAPRDVVMILGLHVLGRRRPPRPHPLRGPAHAARCCDSAAGRAPARLQPVPLGAGQARARRARPPRRRLPRLGDPPPARAPAPAAHRPDRRRARVERACAAYERSVTPRRRALRAASGRRSSSPIRCGPASAASTGPAP